MQKIQMKTMHEFLFCAYKKNYDTHLLSQKVVQWCKI